MTPRMLSIKKFLRYTHQPCYNYSMVMRFNYVGISVSKPGLYPVTWENPYHPTINRLSGGSRYKLIYFNYKKTCRYIQVLGEAMMA